MQVEESSVNQRYRISWTIAGNGQDQPSIRPAAIRTIPSAIRMWVRLVACVFLLGVVGVSSDGVVSAQMVPDEFGSCGRWMPSRAFADTYTTMTGGSGGLGLVPSSAAPLPVAAGGAAVATAGVIAQAAGATAAVGAGAVAAAAFLWGVEAGCTFGEATPVGGWIASGASRVWSAVGWSVGDSILELPPVAGVDEWVNMNGGMVPCESWSWPSWSSGLSVHGSASDLKVPGRRCFWMEGPGELASSTGQAMIAAAWKGSITAGDVTFGPASVPARYRSPYWNAASPSGLDAVPVGWMAPGGAQVRGNQAGWAGGPSVMNSNATPREKLAFSVHCTNNVGGVCGMPPNAYVVYADWTSSAPGAVRGLIPMWGEARARGWQRRIVHDLRCWDGTPGTGGMWWQRVETAPYWDAAPDKRVPNQVCDDGGIPVSVRISRVPTGVGLTVGTSDATYTFFTSDAPSSWWTSSAPAWVTECLPSTADCPAPAFVGAECLWAGEVVNGENCDPGLLIRPGAGQRAPSSGLVTVPLVDVMGGESPLSTETPVLDLPEGAEPPSPPGVTTGIDGGDNSVICRGELLALAFVLIEDGWSVPQVVEALGCRPGDAETAECWPSGWGWFNPADWILRPIKCALVWAFVPEDQVIGDAVDGLVLQAETRAPVSWVYQGTELAITVAGELPGDIEDAEGGCIEIFGAGEWETYASWDQFDFCPEEDLEEVMGDHYATWAGFRGWLGTLVYFFWALGLMATANGLFGRWSAPEDTQLG